VTVDNKLVK